MKKIRMLKVDFTEPIYGHEINYFRGAILHELEKEKNIKKGVLFHNHLEDGKLRWGYPLIQYKRYGKMPQVICFGDGVEQINLLFSKNNFEFKLGNRKVVTEISDLKLNEHVLQIWDRRFEYRLYNWLALNHKNYLKYAAMEEDSERKALLESILVGNILSMAKGLGWSIDKPIELDIKRIDGIKKVQYKKADLMSFNLIFSTNVSLPLRAGLGKGTSIGFGTLSGVAKPKPKTYQNA